MTSERVKKSAIWLILAFALFLRLYYVLNETYEPVEWDQKNYTTMTVQMIEDGVYGYLDTKPNTYVTPGFPMFLYVVFKIFGYSDIMHTHMIVRVIQAFISLGAITFIYLIGKRLFNRPTGWIAALFAAFYGTYVWMTSLILTETLFLTCFMGLMYMQVRIIQENKKWDHLIGGLLLGISVLIRPNCIVVAPVPYVFLWFQERRLCLKEISWGVGMFIVAMLPWWIRNYMTFHEVILLSKEGSGNPFLGGTDPYHMGTIDWSKVNYDDQFGEGLRRIKQGLKEDPWLWIRWFTVGKFKDMFIHHIYLGPYPNFMGNIYGVFLKCFHLFLVYAGIFFSMIGMFINKSVRFLAVNFLIMLGVALLFISEARYTIPMMPYLMITTAAVIVWAGQWAARRFAGRRV
ncbi:putative membrane protein [Paenibacillus larvae subsp. larvae]|uniref:Putative membrane protein n=1 Tax=Paenibacillus larvae subsp. larvae TaxID=147375 RepID=A0A2L1TWZ6_9BACL|nr:glycosyltransferase family 39 protein [Paenibacillus larvae]AQT85800.1 hypothetical protein B1222_17460 [Paenibacillus larvae subsp. pulvifaciens]AQZ45977.1 hypothetical protein B5S25_04505 [Paenibacillus larvae subsp. pulvifaciens]AVF25205.1 putative membrane protein [Paenibacillus larvae subsp. larvae]AVF29982.1 putative membrane protein [Paenibacillus larvae subsp. larvae]MBH0341048.1 hypothetical protein [Paenibacillus larvae]